MHLCNEYILTFTPGLLSFSYLQLQIGEIKALPILGSRQAVALRGPQEGLPLIVRAVLSWPCWAAGFPRLPGVESIRQMEGTN